MARNEQKMAAALEALTTSSTLTEAAEKAGISRRTLYNYIRTENECARAYRNLQDEAATHAAETAAARAEEASSIILDIMRDTTQPSAIRLKAAQIVLDFSEHSRKLASGIANDAVTKTGPLSAFLEDF